MMISRRLLPLLLLPLIYLYFPRRAPRTQWSRFAYSLYATDSAYLCNAVMVFEALERLGSRPDRLLFYPKQWDLEIESPTDRDSQLLVKARDVYKVRLIPVSIGGDSDQQWNGAFIKFLAFNQTQYDRVLHLDSDMVLQTHLDDLFALPPTPVAMMRAYWLWPERRQLTSLLILLVPSTEAYHRLTLAARPDNRPPGGYDMEVLNAEYGHSALVLPHRGLALLSGEFRRPKHTMYLGSSTAPWNADEALREARIVHFSDWPLPKPWIMWPHQLIGEIMPKCEYGKDGQLDNCRNKAVWMGLYDDFRRRRKEICALLSAPAPAWPVESNVAQAS